MLTRTVRPETLDGLAEADPRAMRSRRDLRRVNRVMGAPGIVERGLREAIGPRPRGARLHLLELGAGDGSLMCAVAPRLQDVAPDAELALLDRQRLVDDATIATFAAYGWRASTLQADVVDWARAATDRYDAIVANLFLHHFDDATLTALFGAIAGRCDGFFACEPRRAALALAGSHLIGALGVNAVTREDAVLSVHAGFRDRELTTAWNASGDAGRWAVREYGAGLFSQCFVARRTGR